MSRTKLYWVERMKTPWRGKLAMAARPRGGDWLEDEMADWHGRGLNTVVSFLTQEEELDLGISAEQVEAQAHGLTFISFPIPDREVPASVEEFSRLLAVLDTELTTGKNVVMHCRQGIGRTGLVAACLLASTGIDPRAAMDGLSDARGMTVPETDEQRHWVEEYTASLTASR
jgi:protein-tyrosine phosphatase